ncbi:unnamed protein product [Rhizophagus irregularis]|nr:unnamed protein product [Rhizophagus irregularis]
MQEKQNITYHHNSVPYLCLFDQKNRDFHEERLTIYEQRIVYRKLHGTYKKALSKALQTNSKSQKLINLLQEFIENEEIDEYSDLKDEFQQDDNTNDTSDKENNALVPLLQNPKQHCGKGRLPGTKRFKSAHEVPKVKNQC